MDQHILIALIAAVLNAILSSIVPCVTKKSNESTIVQIRNVFENNKQVILTSSIIVGLTTYVALKLANEIRYDASFSTESPFELSSEPTVLRGIVLTSSGTPLSYLSNLN